MKDERPADHTLYYGDLFTLKDVVQTLSNTGKTGSLEIKTDGKSSYMFFMDGQLIDAVRELSWTGVDNIVIRGGDPMLDPDRLWPLLESAAGLTRVLRITNQEQESLALSTPRVNRSEFSAKLKTLEDVGLGYVHLGQQATTLSGGEAQRIKLARELSRRATGGTLYVLDEPTTGLHFEDVRCLLSVLQRLVDAGNTVVVIEHNLDVIKCADQIIELGPDGGDGGGYIVARGTPEEVAKVGASPTGRYLKDLLGKKK